MIVIDTCGWIEWLTNGKLADEFAKYFILAEDILTPTSIQFELYKWVKQNSGHESALEAIAMTEQTQLVSLDTSISLLAADLAIEHKLSFADAIIYASANFFEAQLVTADNHFQGLENVIYFKK